MNKPLLYIGIMSGTSADGIDVALVDFGSRKPNLVASHFQGYDIELRKRITSLYLPNTNEIDRAFELDVELARLFSQAISTLLAKECINPNDIVAIGNHGQTIRHRPTNNFPFTLQIGCNQTLACLTGIDVIGQFRQKDISLGGQGAPLVPAFHQILFNDKDKDVFIVNIGGISNITFLPFDDTQPILGFDTGPGNALLDDWYQKHNSGEYDVDGQWASTGQVNSTLLSQLLSEPYFNQSAPKSTGREQFHLSWLNKYLTSFKCSPEDTQATLVDLTAISIADAINRLSNSANIYLCGGGKNNNTLKNQIIKKLPNHDVSDTDSKGIDGDSMEAMAFAWLAYANKNNLFSNIPTVTGAQRKAVLGSLYTP